MNWFIPSNREDLLELLSALVIPTELPANLVCRPVADGRLATLDDGLRMSEGQIITGGVARRFPILVETVRRDEGVVRIGDIRCLHFRNADERDQFRFRPVEELDPAWFPYEVSLQLFGHEGESRFECVAKGDSDQGLDGVRADRIAAGVACLLHLVRSEPAIAYPGVSLLGVGDSAEDDIVSRCWNFLGMEESEPPVSERQLWTVVRVFAGADRESGSELINRTLESLRLAGGDEAEAESEEKWARFALEAFENRRDLDGRVLADEKAVVLRAALLAVWVDDVESLRAFLGQNPPAGSRVVTLASFLFGIRRGAGVLSWAVKKPIAGFLSELIAYLIETDSSDSWGNVLGLGLDTSSEDPEPLARLKWHRGTIASFPVQKPAADIRPHRAARDGKFPSRAAIETLAEPRNEELPFDGPLTGDGRPKTEKAAGARQGVGLSAAVQSILDGWGWELAETGKPLITGGVNVALPGGRTFCVKEPVDSVPGVQFSIFSEVPELDRSPTDLAILKLHEKPGVSWWFAVVNRRRMLVANVPQEAGPEVRDHLLGELARTEEAYASAVVTRKRRS